MEATTPELGPVGFWKPKSSSFSGSNSIVVEEAARSFLSPRPSINKSGAPNFFIQHDKVEDSKTNVLNYSIWHYLLTRHAVRPTGKGSSIR